MAEKLEHNFFEKLTDHFVKRECMKDNQIIVSELQSGIYLSNSPSPNENYNTSKTRAVSMHFEEDVEVVPPKIRNRSASCSHRTKIFDADQVNIASKCNSISNNTLVESETSNRKKNKRKGPVELEDFQNDSFFQTLKTLQLEKKGPSGLEKAKEKLITFMSEGSEFMKKQLPRQAAEKYKNAIDMISEANAELYNVKEMEFVTLQYALGHCYIEIANYPDICQGIEIFLEIKKVYASKFPTIYHALGLAYYKLNRFRVATELLKTGLEFLEKKISFESQSWPGTNNAMKLTTVDGLKEELLNLIHLCDAYYLPDAVCRYPQCLSINPHIIPSRHIFCSDPDFIGFIVVHCEENCKIEYHPLCWKNYKESLSCIEKLCDKKVLGKECPTNDCVTYHNQKSSIIRIEIYGNNGSIKSECVKDVANDQKSMIAKSKKKREKLISVSVPEKVKKKVKHKRRVSEPSEEKYQNEPNTAEQPVNDQPYQLQEFACLRKRNFDCDEEQSWDPSKINFGLRTIDNCEKFPTSKYDTMETKATKDFIFRYFTDVLIENGPMEKQFVAKKWSKDFEDSTDLRDFLSPYNNDIIKFLLASHQFALIEDTLCLSKDVPDAYSVTKIVLTESLSFVLNDCPTENLHSHNDNVEANLNNSEVLVPLPSVHFKPEVKSAIISNIEVTETTEVKDESNKSQFETNISPQIEDIFESKSEIIGIKSTLNKVENESLYKEDSNDNIHNYNQSLLVEDTECEAKNNHAENLGTGHSLSSKYSTNIKSYLPSAESIFQMEAVDNSVCTNTNYGSAENESNVIEIFLAEVELILKKKFDAIDQVTMERLKNLMYNYAKANFEPSSIQSILHACNEQMQAAEIDTSFSLALEEIKLNVKRTDEEIETMTKTLIEKLHIQDLKLQKFISLIDTLKKKLIAAEKNYEASNKEKINLYKNKCENNIMYSKLLLQSEKARIDSGMENVMEKLELCNDLLNCITHLEGNNNARSQSNTEDIAVSNTTYVFRQIDEISDYLNIGIQNLLSKTIQNYNLNCEDYVFNKSEQIYNGPTIEMSNVNFYPKLLYSNIGEYYNLHRNLATLPLQQKRLDSPNEVISENSSYYCLINKEPLDQNVYPKTNTSMGNNLNLISRGIISETPYQKSEPTGNELDHLYTNDFFKTRQIWPESYKQLIDRLLLKYVTWERPQIEALLMSIRERNNGLSGLKLVDIFNLVEQEVQERNKLCKGTMGIEKFGDTAWRGIKTNKAWSKPSDVAQDDCVICMDPMIDDTTSLQCMHSFHTKCIKDWLSTKTVCPICQALALSNEEFPPLINMKP